MTPTDIDTIFRNEAGRALATLIRLVGDFESAEDALQDAFAAALTSWASGGQPSNPRAWLVNVGRNKAIDRIRRQIAFRGKQPELLREIELAAADASEARDDATLDDDMLRLIFTCCCTMRAAPDARPPAATSSCWRSRTARCGTARRSPREWGWCKPRCASRAGPNLTRCRRRSPHSMRRRRIMRIPTGRRSRGSMKCCCASAHRR